MAATKTVELIMKVQDATRAGLDSVTSRIADARSKINGGEDGKGGIFGATDKVNQQLGKAAAAAAVISAAASATEVAIKGWTAASSYFSGDLEKQAAAIADIESSVKSLPFGFGKIFSIGQAIREVITGERAELEKINKETDERNKRLETTNKLITDQKKLVGELAKASADALTAATGKQTSIRDQIDAIRFGESDDFEGKRTLASKPIDREISAQVAAIDKANAQLKKVQDELDSGNRFANQDALKKSKQDALDAIQVARVNIADLETLREESLHKIDKEEAEYADKQFKDREAALAKENQLTNQFLQKEFDQRKALDAALTEALNTSASKRSKYEIELLRAAGKTREADRAQILEDFENEVVALQKQAAKVMEQEGATQADKAAAQEALSRQFDTAAQARDLRLYQLDRKQTERPTLAFQDAGRLTGATENREEKQLQTLESILLEIKRANEIEQRRQQVQDNARRMVVERR